MPTLHDDEVAIEDIDPKGLEGELDKAVEDEERAQRGDEPADDADDTPADPDDEPIDDDDDLVDDDDDDLEDEPEAAEKKPDVAAADAPIVREDGATWDKSKSQWRQKDGTFVAGEAPVAKPVVEAKAGEVAEKPAAGKTSEAKWEPFSVTADKKVHAIDGAIVQRVNGHTYLAIPDAKFADFERRIGRGYVAERMSRELDAQIKGVAQAKKDYDDRVAHPEPTSEQIESRIWLEELKKKGVLAEVFEPHELENMDLRIKLALNDAKATYATERDQRKAAESEAPEALQQQQMSGLSEMIVKVAEDADFPELNGLTNDQLRDVFAELKPVAASLYYREKDPATGKMEWYANMEYIHRVLSAKAKGGASAAAPVKTGQPAGATATDKAESFNTGVESAKKPLPSTSVKAASRPNGNRPREGNRPRRRDVRDTRTQEQIDEDEVRAETKKFMSSTGLDY